MHLAIIVDGPVAGQPLCAAYHDPLCCRTRTGRFDAGLSFINLRTLSEAARSLGVGLGTVIWGVVLPNIRSAVLSVGPPETIYRRPATAFVADFLALSNRLHGRIVDGGVEVLGSTLPLVDAATYRNGERTVTALVRPESIDVTPDPAGAPGSSRPASSALPAASRWRCRTTR